MRQKSRQLFGPFVALYDPVGDFGILSNFAKVEFFVGESVFQTAEHFFQSKKFLDETLQAAIRDTKSGSEAKTLAWSEQFSDHVRADWDDVRLSVMRQGLRAKFEQSR